MKKIELLAPAGSMEKLKWAIKYGANAVYIGGRDFSLRANASNFSLDEIKEATDYAHSNLAKLYVTVNIIFHNRDYDGLVEYLKKLEEYKVDAIIIADLGVLQVIKENNININIHLSTQASTLNKESVKYIKSLGIERIVLAREISSQDLIDIKRSVDIEIETFIHGAMCTSYSGRCVMSNYFTNRDSNRGGCSQICRWDFNLENSDDEVLEKDESFGMCPKDLSMYQYLDKLIEYGVDSLKIEGRMRSVYYIATIVNIYRKAIDRYYLDCANYTMNKEDLISLRKCANREAVVHFFDKEPTVLEQYYNGRREVSNQDFLGVVKSYDSLKKLVTLQQRNYFKSGDEVVFFGPNKESFSCVISDIYDEEENIIDVVNHPNQIVSFNVECELKIDDIMRVKW